MPLNGVKGSPGPGTYLMKSTLVNRRFSISGRTVNPSIINKNNNLNT